MVVGYMKPQGCDLKCGGRVSAPPAEHPTARLFYQCGISSWGECPVLKSKQRAFEKARWHRLGLWKRSRRSTRRVLEAMASLLEFPENAARLPSGAEERIRENACRIGFNEELYRTIRYRYSMRDAIDEYLMFTKPFKGR